MPAAELSKAESLCYHPNQPSWMYSMHSNLEDQQLDCSNSSCCVI